MTGRIGIENNGIQVVVTHLPRRRKPQLCLEIDGEIFPVAAFANEGRANWFLGVMEEFFGEKLQ